MREHTKSKVLERRPAYTLEIVSDDKVILKELLPDGWKVHEITDREQIAVLKGMFNPSK